MNEEVNAPSELAPKAKTEFAKRNPHLEKLVPDAIENAVDVLMPDKLEKVLDRGCEKVYTKYQSFRTDLAEGVGEVAGVLFRVAKYAYEKFHFGDLVFGVYQLALHHSTINAMDTVDGKLVTDVDLITFLIQATDAANAAYCPEKTELCQAAGIQPSDLLIFEPQTTTTRPAYAVWVDEANKRIIWGFRGTTDLNDMLTDACASCTSYCGGYAHWGMLQAASWFVDNELPRVAEMVKERSGYKLLLVGHSLGAGTAAMLAHMLKNDAKASAAVEGIEFSAVGVATPAVLTEDLAEACSDYITSVVLMHDLVPRFSIHNVFDLKEEMDATDWGDILLKTAKDWAVPDVIENSETYKRLTKKTKQQWRSATAVAADAYLWMQNWAISGLHYAGVIKPNPEAQHSQNAGSVGQAAAATAATARAAVMDPSVLQQAVESVGEQVANVAKEDVHRVFAPGKIYFIKRLDKHKGRAKYGNTVHVCRLCERDEELPPVDHCDHEHDAPSAAESAAAAASTADVAAGDSAAAAAVGATAAATASSSRDAAGAAAEKPEQKEFYPGAQFELIEASDKQRFQRIVLRETCLMDHLTGGYIQGLKYALEKAQQRKQ